MEKKYEILTTFTGYPDDTNASRTEYPAGATVEFEDAYGALMVAKGLAREIEPKPASMSAMDSKTKGDKLEAI